jgi:hypothetical protein
VFGRHLNVEYELVPDHDEAGPHQRIIVRGIREGNTQIPVESMTGLDVTLKLFMDHVLGRVPTTS